MPASKTPREPQEEGRQLPLPSVRGVTAENEGPGQQRIVAESERMFGGIGKLMEAGDFEGAERLTLAAHGQAIAEGKPGALEARDNYLAAKNTKRDDAPERSRPRGRGR